MRYIYVIIFFLTATFTLSEAQEIVLRVEYPRVVTTGEQIRLVYTVNSSGGDFESPPFDNFYKLSGPNTSYSSSTRIVNNKRTTETSYSYIFYLQATKEGIFTIPPAKYLKGGKTYQSDPAEIEVIKDASGRSGAAQGEQQSETDQAAGDTDMFVKVLLSKREVFVGEPVVATVKFFTRTDIAGFNEIKYPSFNGFLREEIETPDLTSLERENVDGAIYGTGVFQRFLLYPQRTGVVSIDPVNLTVLLRQRSGISDPFFGDVFQSFTTVPRVLVSQPQTIVVKPLPGNRPAGFTGAVGLFEIRSEIDNDTVIVNDALTFKIELSGRGNFRLADAPSVSFPAGLEIYDPKTTTNVVNSESGTSGSRTFEYLIIPRSSGDFAIPSINWSYFDPAGNRYNTVSTAPVRFHVNKGDISQTGPQLLSPASGEDIQYLGRDIRFIRIPSGDLRKSGASVLSNRVFYSAFGFSMLLFALIILIRREQVKRNSDKAKLMNRRAGRIAAKRLKTAHKYMKSAENEKFYEEVLRSLWGYASNKLNISLSELSGEKAAEVMKMRGDVSGLSERLLELTNVCEMVRYAPASLGDDPEKVYERADKLIRDMEEQLN
jgi:hypothetical protein